MLAMKLRKSVLPLCRDAGKKQKAEYGNDKIAHLVTVKKITAKRFMRITTHCELQH